MTIIAVLFGIDIAIVAFVLRRCDRFTLLQRFVVLFTFPRPK